MASFQKSLSRASLWLLPLAIATVAYLWPLGNEESEGQARQDSGKREVRRTARTEKEAMAAFEKAQDDAAAARKTEGERLEKLDGAAKRAEILRLVALLKNGKEPWSWEVGGRLDHLCYDLAKAEGTEGMRWLEEAAPEQVKGALEAWCLNEPEAAYDYLVQSQRSGECIPSWAMRALAAHVQAEGGGAEALMDAVKRMPWYLFRETTEERERIFYAPDGVPLKLWVESGATDYLASQGVEVEGIIDHLLPEEPGLVVGMWMRRAAEEPAQGDAQVKEMMGRFPLCTPEEKGALRQALLDAGPGTLDLFKASVGRLYELGSAKGGLGEWGNPEPREVKDGDEVNLWWKALFSEQRAAHQPPEESPAGEEQ